MSENIIDVAAGLIMRPDGQLLLAQRPQGKSWAGWWELPGGKLEAGETVLQTLARELREELDITVTEATPWVTYVHAYPKTTVRLAFCRVTGWTGEARGMERQALRWVDPEHATAVGDLLPATLPTLRWLRLPDTYAITQIGQADALPAMMRNLERALQGGLKLVQLREPAWPGGPAAPSLHAAMGRVVAACRQHGARVLINSVHPESWWRDADGVHLRAADAARAALEQASGQPGRPAGWDGMLLGVSAHHAGDIEQARALDADFAVLGPVLPTPTHPGQPGLGWPGFMATIRDAGLPVYALGGQSENTRLTAKSHGAHGVAGIRGWIG